jgi:5-methylcytosine-specific restriction endonuclease McrA
LRSKVAAYRLAHKPEMAARMRRYRKENPDRVRASELRRVRPEGFRKKFNSYRRQWATDNWDKIQAYYQRRRANKKDGNDLTAAQIMQQRRDQCGMCFYGNHPLDNNGRGHVDHKTPLCLGGRNTAANIVIACSVCNLKKGRKTYEQFIESLRD